MKAFVIFILLLKIFNATCWMPIGRFRPNTQCENVVMNMPSDPFDTEEQILSDNQFQQDEDPLLQKDKKGSFEDEDSSLYMVDDPLNAILHEDDKAKKDIKIKDRSSNLESELNEQQNSEISYEKLDELSKTSSDEDNKIISNQENSEDNIDTGLENIENANDKPTHKKQGLVKMINSKRHVNHPSNQKQCCTAKGNKLQDHKKIAATRNTDTALKDDISEYSRKKNIGTKEKIIDSLDSQNIAREEKLINFQENSDTDDIKNELDNGDNSNSADAQNEEIAKKLLLLKQQELLDQPPVIRTDKPKESQHYSNTAKTTVEKDLEEEESEFPSKNRNIVDSLNSKRSVKHHLKQHQNSKVKDENLKDPSNTIDTEDNKNIEAGEDISNENNKGKQVNLDDENENLIVNGVEAENDLSSIKKQRPENSKRNIKNRPLHKKNCKVKERKLRDSQESSDSDITVMLLRPYVGYRGHDMHQPVREELDSGTPDILLYDMISGSAEAVMKSESASEIKTGQSKTLFKRDTLYNDIQSLNNNLRKLQEKNQNQGNNNNEERM